MEVAGQREESEAVGAQPVRVQKASETPKEECRKRIAKKDRTEEYRTRNAKRKSDTRSRQGRKQSRQGRKQSRRSRKQSCDRRHRKTFRVLNVQRPWARLLLTGVKKVDVRKYPLKNYMDENLWLLETKGEGAPRDFASRKIGSIRYDGCLLT